MELRYLEAYGEPGAVVYRAGVVVGLFGERWARSRGEVLCEVDFWSPWQTGSRPDGGATVEERRLGVTFSNRKDVPVTVWEMRVEFYKGDRPLEAWAEPHLEFVDDEDRRTPLGPVDLHPRVSVPLTITAALGRADKTKAMEGVTRAEFVAKMVGTRDIRRPLPGPWHLPPSSPED